MSREPKLKVREKRTRKMTRDGAIERNAVTGETVRVSHREAAFDLRGDLPERELFSQTRKGSKRTSRPKQRQRRPERHEPQTSDAEPPRDISVSPTNDDAPHSDASESDSPIEADKPRSTPKSKLKTGTSEKLRVSDVAAPEAPLNRKLNKAQARAEHSAHKLESAKNHLPAKKKLRSERVFDERKGKASQKLYFESEVKTQSQHLEGALPTRPVKAAGNAAVGFGHRKLHQVEHENVGTQAAHKAEMGAESVTRVALRHHKLSPYRKVSKLEHQTAKKTIKAEYRKVVAENPKLKSNALSRAFQKRKIKKDYAKTVRDAKKNADRVKQTGSAVSRASKAVAGIVKRHPVGTASVVLVSLLLFTVMSLIGAFGGAASGGFGGILTASYLAEDADVDAAELAYTEWETDLQLQIASAETTHAGYDEYRYSVGDISHNPYELMAALTVLHQNFSYAAVQTELAAWFNDQYTLAFTPTLETRYADPIDANNDGDYEPYEWSVMTVTLTARSFSEVAAARLNGVQLAHYALLLQSKGSRQYVANPFDVEWLSRISSYYGYSVNPANSTKTLSRGVEIAMPQGTEIRAGHAGTVTVGHDAAFGNYVTLIGTNGVTTQYARCGSVLVANGQSVATGDVIATVGSAGMYLEVLKNGQYLNPLFFVDTGSFSLLPSYGYAGEPMGDGTYAALIAEAEKYLGYPYVWGGSSPATSFDCSGYISWVLKQSGVYNVGRTSAQGLYNLCTPIAPSDAMPGDLVFFTGTYSSASPVTHVGIYVGYINGYPTMLHCGKPIQYTRIDTAYWQSHAYGFGRIN